MHRSEGARGAARQSFDDRVIVASALLLAAYVWWRTAWVCDDAYLGFRTIEMWFAGHGPNFNPGQRVFGHTSPLWFFLQSAGRLVYGDLYWVTLALSAALGIVTLSIAWRLLGDGRAWATWLLLLVGSRALLDYSSSGLETPLIYALLTAFAWRSAIVFRDGPTGRRLLAVAGIVGLLAVTRHDLVVVVAPTFAWMLLRWRSALPARRWALVLTAAAAPVLAWSAFSLFYHGSLLPPAIHPKMSLARYGERAEVLRQGLTNLRVILYDPVSLIVLVAGAVGCLRRGTAAALLALGGLLYLATYVVYGGDWMDARIFTPLLIVLLPFAATTLASATRRHLFVPAVAAGALLALWWPAYPWAFEWPENVVNHRALMRDWNAFYRGDGSRMQPSHSRMVCPDWDRLRPRDVTTFNPRFAKRVMKAPRMQPTFLAEQWACALLFQRSKVPVAADYILALGLFSYFAGTDKFVVERLLLDPLVTRLPPSYGGRYSYHINPNFRPGHVWHDIPPRYVESLVVGQNRIPDPAIARLFDDVQLATQAPLLAPGRFAAIWRLNTGHDYGTDAAWRNGAQPMREQGRRPGASPASAVAPGQRG